MPLKIAHLTASPNFGGVERLILEISRLLGHTKDAQHILASFPEGGKAQSFLCEAEKAGLPVYCFQNDMPHLIAATFELIRLLQQHQIQILCAHGHKARMLGWFAARRLRIPIIGISHGWTGENKKIQFYERIDQWMHRRMDHIVCVSQGQADKVIRSGTPAGRVSVIYNAVRMDRFDTVSGISFRQHLEAMFPSKPKFIIGAAGRLSPEKGFDLLISAAKTLTDKTLTEPQSFDCDKKGADKGQTAEENRQTVNSPNIGFVLFGDGTLQEALQKQIDEAGISPFVKLAGFTDRLDQYMPHFDLFVQSSRTEGLPSVLLEAMAAKRAVVATKVGGTGELVAEGSAAEDSTGFMVPPNDPVALAAAIQKVLNDDKLRRTMGENGRKRIEQNFTIEAQTEAYWNLFCRLISLRGV